MAALVLLVVVVVAWGRYHDSRTAAELRTTRTCYVTGGGALEVCHRAADEGVYYQPSSSQVAYNVQIIRYRDAQYATVLHSEALDLPHYRRITGHLRPGDSIKAGTVDASQNPALVYSVPANLDYRIWGTLTNRNSPLYYAVGPEADDQNGIGGAGGGGNPMVVQGRKSAGDDWFYMFFLGVSSDEFQYRGDDWRNVLLEARTRDFQHFDMLTGNSQAGSAWSSFKGDAAVPTVVRSVSGKPIVSNHPAGRTARGAIPTAGLIGSISEYAGVYYYFYTDQDPTYPRRNHLYLRTATDISHDGAWSDPQVVLDTPPEILIRVAKAAGMNRWAVFYNCLREAERTISDICLQYTDNMSISDPGGISRLELFDGPTYTGKSRYFLGLIGRNNGYSDGSYLKAQHFYLVDPMGNLLSLPADQQGRKRSDMLTWMDMPKNFNVFGAPVYWAEWDVSPTSNPP